MARLSKREQGKVISSQIKLDIKEFGFDYEVTWEGAVRLFLGDTYVHTVSYMFAQDRAHMRGFMKERIKWYTKHKGYIPF